MLAGRPRFQFWPSLSFSFRLSCSGSCARLVIMQSLHVARRSWRHFPATNWCLFYSQSETGRAQASERHLIERILLAILAQLAIERGKRRRRWPHVSSSLSLCAGAANFGAGLSSSSHLNSRCSHLFSQNTISITASSLNT